MSQKPVFPARFAVFGSRQDAHTLWSPVAAGKTDNSPKTRPRQDRTALCSPVAAEIPCAILWRSVHCAAFCLSRVTIARSTAFCPGRITIVIPPNSDMAYGPLLSPPHSNIAQNRLPNTMIINELLHPFCLRRNSKRDWTEGFNIRMGHHEYV